MLTQTREGKLDLITSHQGLKRPHSQFSAIQSIIHRDGLRRLFGIAVAGWHLGQSGSAQGSVAMVAKQ